MSVEREVLDTEEKIEAAIEACKARYDELNAAGTDYLLPATVTEMNNECLDLSTLKMARNAAKSAEAIRVNNVEVAGERLLNLNAWYLTELNGHVELGDVPAGVYSMFGLPLSGIHPDMKSEDSKQTVSNNIKLGNAAMLLVPYPVNTAFTAARVLTQYNIYKPQLTDKNAKKGLFGMAQRSLTLRGEDTIVTLDVIFDAVVFNNSTLSESALREELDLWGFHYKTAKVKTIIAGRIFGPDGITGAAGAEIRIGKDVNKDGKRSKEGVVVHADANGHFSAITEIDNATFINVRMLNCADKSVPTTIEAGVNQLLHVINLVAGTSSL